MKALVYHRPGQSAWESAPDPVIGAPTDAIVWITSSTICGTDALKVVLSAHPVHLEPGEAKELVTAF